MLIEHPDAAAQAEATEPVSDRAVQALQYATAGLAVIAAALLTSFR